MPAILPTELETDNYPIKFGRRLVIEKEGNEIQKSNN